MSVLSYGAAALRETEEAEGRAGESRDGPGEWRKFNKLFQSPFVRAHKGWMQCLNTPLFIAYRVNMSFLQRSSLANWLRLCTENLRGKSKVGGCISFFKLISSSVNENRY